MIHSAYADLQLGELLIVWEQANAKGETLSVEHLCREFPELAFELNRQIEALRDWNLMATETLAPSSSSAEAATAATETTPASASLTVQLSDLRFHDHGGLGVIYKARHENLPRDVALKFIRQDRAANHDCSGRFLREAQITARLEHPGIVPIYGLGQDETGNPCYAMRFVEGTTLDQAIKQYHAKRNSDGDRSSLQTDRSFRSLLQRFKAACTTIGYAHSRGVLHRDIKPANIMLGPFDATLVLDWGLGKIIATDGTKGVNDRKEEAEWRSAGPDEIQTLGVIGTPGFMSPEQHSGQWDTVGPASDVYGLGATLYVLLTGKSPFPGRGPGEIAEKVKRGDFIRPRHAMPEIPRPLEAVCLKAMDVRPENRYASSLALADDLERWLADEPVTVVRESNVNRAARWGRRHRAATLAGMVALALVTVAAVVATVVVSVARTSERRALSRAEARTDLAVEAVRKFHDAVNDNLDVRNRPDLAGLRKKLLGEPLKFFEQLRDDLQKGRDVNPATTLKLARANLEFTPRLSDEIGSKADAVRSYQAAIAMLGPFDVLKPSAGDRVRQEGQTALADALGQLGTLQSSLGKSDLARACLEKALGISARLTRESTAPIYHVAHASLLRRLAQVEGPEFPDKAISLLEEAVAELRPLANERLVLPVNPDLLVSMYANLGSVLKATGRKSEAADRFRIAIDALERLLRDSPESQVFRANLATAWYNLGNLQLTDNKFTNVRASFERARDLWEKLAREFPSSSHYRSMLVGAHGILGVLHENADQLEEARAELNRSREIGESLVHDHPTVLLYRSDLGKTLINLSGLETKVGRTGASVALVEAACGYLREVFRMRPGDRSARDALRTACAGLGDGLFATDRHADALEAFRESANLELELTRTPDHQSSPDHLLLAKGLLGMARCHLYLGHVAQAASLAEEWRACWNDNPKELHQVAREMVKCSTAAPSSEAAQRYADWAVDLLRQSVRAGFRNRDWLQAEPDFMPLHPRSDFREILLDVVFPNDPFAR